MHINVKEEARSTIRAPQFTCQAITLDKHFTRDAAYKPNQGEEKKS